MIFSIPPFYRENVFDKSAADTRQLRAEGATRLGKSKGGEFFGYFPQVYHRHSIDFLGWLEPQRVPELINSVSMMVVPSRWNEPFGLVALQAAQMARPVVATRMGGLPEVVIDRQTGLLVEPDNAAALADAIVNLIENPTTAIQMGNAARQRAREVFGWKRVLDAYDALYQKVGRMRQG